MKSIKNYLYLLLVGTVILFSACDELEHSVDRQPIEPTVEVDPNSVSTLEPVIGEDQITFQASLKNPDGVIEYGFMWYIKPLGQEEAQVHRVVVRAGNYEGYYRKFMNDLPKGVDLVVCAFVDFRDPTQQVTNNIGEEISFNIDL